MTSDKKLGTGTPTTSLSDVERSASVDLAAISTRTEAELHEFHYDAATLHNVAVINNAVEVCGMGRYQWQMFFTCGFGFFVDQVHEEMTLESGLFS
jgi:hypothetical protein